LAAFSLPLAFDAPATSELYTLSLHDALPISVLAPLRVVALAEHPAEVLERELGVDGHDPLADGDGGVHLLARAEGMLGRPVLTRSEEHTSELQSRSDLVCRLLLEKKKK